MESPYKKHSDQPQLQLSWVCYADILGYKQLTEDAINNGECQNFLNTLNEALSHSYNRIQRLLVNGEKAIWAVKTFTDNIVIGYPARNADINDGVPEFVSVLNIFMEFQAGLAMKGFFLRGGVAFGEHYMDEDIVFGEAFLEAVKQDRRGGPPCISLAPSAIERFKKIADYYKYPHSTPHYESLLKDADGSIYLNYLSEAIRDFPDFEIYFDLIKKHNKQIVRGLINYKAKPDIRAKYEWLARYHNFFCQEIYENYNSPSYNDHSNSEMQAVYAKETEKLLTYKIDIESLAASPSRLDDY